MKEAAPFSRGLGVWRVAGLIVLFAAACGKDTATTPSPSVYAGNWSGLQSHSASLVGTGVQLTIVGQTITSVTVETEDFFGSAPQPGCLVVFTASGQTTIAGTSFSVPLTLGSTAIAGISSLPVATAATFTGPSTLQGTFSSPTEMSGQLNYTIGSATCAGATYSGVIPTPGFGNQVRAFTASR
jgi:hypothetical protein